ncbi:unnamed protein product [Mytilus edulis]|uniref:Reverse transcriptase domain-containing protein n=1 Tax=Mytilus edulis TaxID=6550 RepID=A0A8S3VJ91_MYTED|nr:unnamed protein product [Mytilus edulis]
MDSKLKSVRAGHKGAVTKLLVKFDELKSKTDTEVDEVKALDDAVTQKQKTLIDLNNRLLEQTSEENLEQEITDSDEYMYELDCKIRQIRKFIKSFETNIISHDTVGPSTSRLNPDAYNFTPEARVDMNTCAIDSMNQQYSIHAPAVHTHWKTSVIIPLFKGGNKNKTDPNSYRGISLTSCIAKIFEKSLYPRFDSVYIKFPHQSQMAYQKELSSIHASFNLQESIRHYIERNSDVIVVLLDSTKAFDSVWHDALFYELHKYGVTGDLWLLIDEIYSEMRSSVLFNGGLVGLN